MGTTGDNSNIRPQIGTNGEQVHLDPEVEIQLQKINYGFLKSPVPTQTDDELRKLWSMIDTRIHRNTTLTPEHRHILVEQIMQLIQADRKALQLTIAAERAKVSQLQTMLDAEKTRETEIRLDEHRKNIRQFAEQATYTGYADYLAQRNIELEAARKGE